LTEPKHIPFIKTVPKSHAKQLLSAGFKLTHPLLILVQFPEIRLKVGWQAKQVFVGLYTIHLLIV
jgi:hypothetical protein